MIGWVIDGSYRIDRVIGEGGFGIVLGGHDLRLDRPVAVKMLRAPSVDERTLTRFLNEARNLASLNHPHVVQIFRLGVHEAQHYIVMEYVDGPTLAQVIREGSFDLPGRLELMRQVASGLRAIHELGILHRDLSTGNIMVTARGVAKILDLGLSTSLHGSLTTTMDVLRGTVPYFAPEQVLGRETTRLSEIFSFGSILYECVCGESPFQGEHFTSVIYGIVNRDPEPIQARLPECSARLADLLGRCLSRQPSDRPQSMQEVEAALTRVLAENGSAPVSAPAPVRAPIRAPAAPNPYLNRVMIKRNEDFFGRRQEVQRIFARLNATPPGSISLVGERRIGKSSLLNFVYSKQQRERFLEAPDRTVMVFLDLQMEKGMSVKSFVRNLLALASYELGGRLDVSDCALDLDGVKDMVQRMDREGLRLAILLDEFEAVTTNPSFSLEFFSFLRHLANHYNVAYLTTSRRNLQVLCHTKEISDSPFFNIFSSMRLSTFQRAEAEELVAVPSARAGHPLKPMTGPILELAGRFPLFIQIACAHAIECRLERPGAELDFEEVRKRFAEEAQPHLRYVWEGFDEHEVDAMRRVAQGKRVPESLRHVVEELAGRGYVDLEGGPKASGSAFGDFVLAQSARGSGASALARWLRMGGRQTSGR